MRIEYLNKKKTWELDLDLRIDLACWSLPVCVYWDFMEFHSDFEPGLYYCVGFSFLCFGISITVLKWRNGKM